MIHFKAIIGGLKVRKDGEARVVLEIPVSHLAESMSLVTLLEKYLDVTIDKSEEQERIAHDPE